MRLLTMIYGICGMAIGSFLLTHCHNHNNDEKCLDTSDLDYSSLKDEFASVASYDDLCYAAQVNNYIVASKRPHLPANTSLEELTGRLGRLDTNSFFDDIAQRTEDIPVSIRHKAHQFFIAQKKAPQNESYVRLIDSIGRTPPIDFDIFRWENEKKSLIEIHKDSDIQRLIPHWIEIILLNPRARDYLVGKVLAIQANAWGIRPNEAVYFSEKGETSYSGRFNPSSMQIEFAISPRSRFINSEKFLGTIAHENNHYIMAYYYKIHSKHATPEIADFLYATNYIYYDHDNYGTTLYKSSPKEVLAYQSGDLWHIYLRDGFDAAIEFVNDRLERAYERRDARDRFQTAWRHEGSHNCVPS